MNKAVDALVPLIAEVAADVELREGWLTTTSAAGADLCSASKRLYGFNRNEKSAELTLGNSSRLIPELRPLLTPSVLAVMQAWQRR